MKKILLIVLVSMAMAACKVYSFTGANIDPEIKTISIEYIYNKSSNGPAEASDLFTNILKEKMLTSTSLKSVNVGGDVQFSGVISGYSYSIQAPTGNLSSDLRRITMQVSISYMNGINEEDGFENQTFSRYADYPVTEDLAAVEESIIREISKQLVDDIVNKAFVKW